MFETKFNKIIWTVNGIGFFIVLLFGLIRVVYEEILPFIGSSDTERGIIVGRGKAKAAELNLSIQHVMYEIPKKINKSNYLFTKVIILDKELPEEVKRSMAAMNDINYSYIGAPINIIFFKDDRSETHKLLKTNGYIETMIYPDGYYEQFKNLPFILYQIADEDTNNDSRINDEDNLAYYISDLDGKNLMQITPDSISLQKHQFNRDFTELYFIEEIKGDKQEVNGLSYYLREHRTYYYNLNSKKFGSYDELQNVFKEIELEFKKTN